MTKEYEGTCYIGVVGPEVVPITAATSIIAIERNEDDGIPQFIAATKGFVARQTIINNFIASEHDFLLLLDHDMIFEPDTLSKLRAHKMPYVSGYYMRRQLNPLYSVWFEPFDGDWPFTPVLWEPERGMLHELGASGWGCILVHREVIEGTRKKVLKGEWDVLEDDMDVWPYDLEAVMKGEEQIRPLRADKGDIIGSDIRFPFYAKAAGYTLYGDPDVRPKHVAQYPISPDDFSGMSVGKLAELQHNAKKHIDTKKHELRERLQMVAA
jgi:hypothetical protein